MADAKDEVAVEAAIKKHAPKLRTWLTSHLADKTMEDVRGKVGINRLRREIQDQFNQLMFDDGRERVGDVLFEEFHVE
jgi:flagellar basal body-associated protein FliL